MGKILRANLSAGKISEEPLSEVTARRFLGGSGLATKYLYDEMEPGTKISGESICRAYLLGNFHQS